MVRRMGGRKPRSGNKRNGDKKDILQKNDYIASPIQRIFTIIDQNDDRARSFEMRAEKSEKDTKVDNEEEL